MGNPGLLDQQEEKEAASRKFHRDSAPGQIFHSNSAFCFALHVSKLDKYNFLVEFRWIESDDLSAASEMGLVSSLKIN